MSTLMLYQKKQQCDIKVGTNIQKNGWVSFSNNMIYISRDKGRSYALFDNCAKANVRRPKLTFYTTKYAVKYGSTVITFKGKSAAANYAAAKKLIGKWAK